MNEQTATMTRKEAYEALIGTLRKMRELKQKLNSHGNTLKTLRRDMPNFHSVSSFEELIEMELIEQSLNPQIERLTQIISESEMEFAVLHDNARDLIENYRFDRICYIFFEHDGQELTLHVQKFMAGTDFWKLKS